MEPLTPITNEFRKLVGKAEPHNLERLKPLARHLQAGQSDMAIKVLNELCTEMLNSARSEEELGPRAKAHSFFQILTVRLDELRPTLQAKFNALDNGSWHDLAVEAMIAVLPGPLRSPNAFSLEQLREQLAVLRNNWESRPHSS